jgi:hypothetical protein
MFWCAKIASYSDCILTYGQDKLPTISGLAWALAPKIGSKYLAGLWENDLSRGLAWTRQGNPTLFYPMFLNTSRAPSWSWASIDGEFGYPHMRSHVAMLEAYKG